MTSKLAPSKIKYLIDYWWKLSEDDFKASSDIFIKSKRNVHALFFLHLSIEKALKACYVKHHQTQAPYSHHVFQLFEKLNIEEKLVLQYKNFLTTVNKFNIEARYPSVKLILHKMASNKYVMIKLKETKDFLKWLKKRYITNA